MRAIPQSRLVMVNVQANTTAGASVQFPDVPELNGRRIIGLEFYDFDMMSVAPNGQPGIAAADTAKLTFTFQDTNSVEVVKSIPAATLQSVSMAGIWKQFDPFVAKFQACTADFAAAPAATAFTIPVNVFYE